MPITHPAVVVVADDGTSPVGSDEWNAAHKIILPGFPFLGHHVGATADRWYTTPTSAVLTTAVPAVNTLFAFPFGTSKDVIVDRIAVNVTAAGAGSEVRAGIYTDDGNLYPSTLLVDSGILDTSTTGVKSATISQALTGGVLYWLTLLAKATAPTLRAAAAVNPVSLLGYDNTLPAAVAGWAWLVAQTYGALPGTYPASATVNTGNNRAVPFIRLT